MYNLYQLLNKLISRAPDIIHGQVHIYTIYIF